MKKLLSVLVITGMAALVACGPSAEEIAAKEKAKADSIAAVQKAKEDSIAAAQKLIDDSIAAAVQKAKEDSIANAGKKTTKPSKPATTTPTNDKTKVKAGQGKG